MTTALAPQLSRSITVGNWLPASGKVGEVVTPSRLDQSNFAFLQLLRSVAGEASERNWDGYGAEPVSSETLAMGKNFFYRMPAAYPKPDISSHPNGDLAFEWYVSPRRILTVTINDSGRLNYAWMIGVDRQYGTKHLLDRFPEEITAALRNIYSEGQTSVR